LDAGGNGIDTGGEFEEVELFVLFADGVLGVDAGDVAVALLDCLDGVLGERISACAYVSNHTFFSFAFSAVSSLPAFAACRFSCLAVNCWW
jgi:hypothetical protein